MKVKRWFAVGLVLVGAVPVACGGGGDGGGKDEEETGPEFAEVPELLAEAYCDALAGCMPPSLIAQFLGTRNCDAYARKQLENGFLTAVETAIEEGTVTYHPGRVKACLNEIRQGGCTANAYLEECEAALAGTVATEGDCMQDAECIGDRFCRVDDLCPGVCSPKREDGERCAREEECSSGSVCHEGRCTSELRAGDECESCGVGCGGGLFCLGADEETGETGTCQSLNDLFTAPEGEPCDIEGELCEPGASCAASVEGGEVSWTCEPPASSGGDCQLAIPDMCPTGEYCAGLAPRVGVLQGICSQLPTEGLDCLPGDCGGGRCAADHACVEGICRRLKPNGESCAGKAECYSDHCDESGLCGPDTPCSI